MNSFSLKPSFWLAGLAFAGVAMGAFAAMAAGATFSFLFCKCDVSLKLGVLIGAGGATAADAAMGFAAIGAGERLSMVLSVSVLGVSTGRGASATRALACAATDFTTVAAALAATALSTLGAGALAAGFVTTDLALTALATTDLALTDLALTAARVGAAFADAFARATACRARALAADVLAVAVFAAAFTAAVFAEVFAAVLTFLPAVFGGILLALLTADFPADFAFFTALFTVAALRADALFATVRDAPFAALALALHDLALLLAFVAAAPRADFAAPRAPAALLPTAACVEVASRPRNDLDLLADPLARRPAAVEAEARWVFAAFLLDGIREILLCCPALETGRASQTGWRGAKAVTKHQKRAKAAYHSTTC